VDKWTLNGTKNQPVMYINSSCIGLFVDIINNLYCSSANEHRVFKIELKMNMTMPKMTVAGTGCHGPVASTLDYPHGIFVDENLNLFVADTNNNRIQRFESNQMNAVTVAGFGAFITFILSRPTSVFLDGNGYLFIVDSQNHRIIRSVSNGFECLFGCSGENGASANLLNNPQAMAFDKDGNIFVTDFNNHRIQKFILTRTSSGTYVHLVIG
jgi:DNA-binding beta-propeller fold protein YncE